MAVEMFKGAMVVIIILGLVSFGLIIKDYNKNTINKYEKIQFRIDIISCVFYILIASLILCDIISSNILWLVILVKYGNILIERKLKVKIQE